MLGTVMTIIIITVMGFSVTDDLLYLKWTFIKLTFLEIYIFKTIKNT